MFKVKNICGKIQSLKLASHRSYKTTTCNEEGKNSKIKWLP
jgi:hypothetical protein